eukprot:gene907-534_t
MCAGYQIRVALWRYVNFEGKDGLTRCGKRFVNFITTRFRNGSTCIAEEKENGCGATISRVDVCELFLFEFSHRKVLSYA